MINVEDIVYKAKVSGYHIYYDGNFISVFDEDITVNKNAHCLFREDIDCYSKKDFETEAIYAISKVNEI